MYKNKKIIGIIPARSGSKGLKDKNIRLLKGKPLMAYTIKCAEDTDVFDTIFVSTDSPHYAEIANEWGAETPFLRPEVLSNDKASTNSLIVHTLEEYKKIGKEFDYFVLLQPTSPLRQPQHIMEGLNLAIGQDLPSVVSVCPLEHPYEVYHLLTEDMSLTPFCIDMNLRQEMHTAYRPNGAIYVGNCIDFLDQKRIYRPDGKVFVMPLENSVDIDTLFDFEQVERIITTEGTSNS